LVHGEESEQDCPIEAVVLAVRRPVVGRGIDPWVGGRVGGRRFGQKRRGLSSPTLAILGDAVARRFEIGEGRLEPVATIVGTSRTIAGRRLGRVGTDGGGRHWYSIAQGQDGVHIDAVLTCLWQHVEQQGGDGAALKAEETGRGRARLGDRDRDAGINGQ
jgi:hypothetical protein